METTNDRRKRRLRWLADKHSLLDIAAKAKVSLGGLDQVLKGTLLPAKADGTRSPRSLGDRAAHAIEDAYKLGRGWFDLPGNDGLTDERQSTALPEFDNPGKHAVGNAALAHQSSELDVRLPSKRVRLEWRDLVVLKEDELPTQFEVRVPDDALAGMMERGEWAICSRTAKPRVNKAVLVADDVGGYYLRRYEEGAGGRWFATSTMPGRRELAGGVDVHLVATVLGSYFDEDNP